jgi:hypothetical protein
MKQDFLEQLPNVTKSIKVTAPDGSIYEIKQLRDPVETVKAAEKTLLSEGGGIPFFQEPSGLNLDLGARQPVLSILPPDFEIPTFKLPVQPSSGAHIPEEYDPRPLRPKTDGLEALDHPIIGGKFTICVLCYGPHTDLAKRCLDSILTSLPRSRIDLRIATNEAATETINYVDSLRPDVLYLHEDNRKKYPAMREMFHDPAHPLQTRYLVWFDDDAMVVDKQWAVRLAETIVTNHREGCRLFGDKHFHNLANYLSVNQQPVHRPDLWFRRAAWFKGVQFNTKRGQPAPNGACVDFVVGWFWAIATETIRLADIPDARLNHNGGDITIGAQVTQTGAGMCQFNKNKAIVWCPKKEDGGRRGYEEAFPWARPIN